MQFPEGWAKEKKVKYLFLSGFLTLADLEEGGGASARGIQGQRYEEDSRLCHTEESSYGERRKNPSILAL